MSDETQEQCERCAKLEKQAEQLRAEMGAVMEALVAINPSISHALHKLSVLTYQAGEVLKEG